jgi:ABC-type ATPase involved in cell division
MIRVVELHKSFAGHNVLMGVNLEIERGKITTVIGGSGCGKTVLLKHLNALLLPDQGQVIVDGVDITRSGEKKLNRMRQRFGVLFQGAALLDSLNLFDNVAFPVREKTRMRDEEIKRKVDERLYQVGLQGMGYKYPAEVSGGMKKRAGLARALMKNLWSRIAPLFNNSLKETRRDRYKSCRGSRSEPDTHKDRCRGFRCGRDYMPHLSRLPAGKAGVIEQPGHCRMR